MASEYAGGDLKLPYVPRRNDGGNNDIIKLVFLSKAHYTVLVVGVNSYTVYSLHQTYFINRRLVFSPSKRKKKKKRKKPLQNKDESYR